MPALYFTMTALLSLKADGRFPYGALDDSLYQCVLLIYTLLFIGLAVIFGFRGECGPPNLERTVQSSWAYLAACQIMFLVLIPLEASKFGAFGYSLNLVSFGSLILVSLVGLLYGRRTGRLFEVAVVLHCCGQLFSILSFPLNPERSDMLPLISSALTRFIRGGLGLGAPYGSYDLGHVLPLTYLPGLWLSYLPAALFDFDLRWLNVFFSISSTALIAQIPAIGRRGQAFLAIFLLTPYFQYRHEIYLAPFFIEIAIFMWLLHDGRLLLASLALAFLLLSSQLFWPTLPIFALFLYRQIGFGKAILAISLILSSVVVVLSIFILPDALNQLSQPASIFNLPAFGVAIKETQFFKGVFLHWKVAENLDAMNMAAWVLKSGNKQTLIWAQASWLVFLSCWMFRRKSIDAAACLLYMGFAVLGFVLFNRVVWSYFYLVFLFLAACYGAARLEQTGSPSKANSILH